MKIEYVEKKIKDIEADLELIVVVNKDFKHPFCKKHKETLEEIGFSAAQNETALLPESKKLFVGAKSMDSLDIRPAVATALRSIVHKKYSSVKIATYLGSKCTAALRATAEAAILGTYTFEKFKSKKEKTELKKVYISNEGYLDNSVSTESAQSAVKKGVTVAKSVNVTRDIVNTPPDDFYPKIFAKTAKELEKYENIKVKVLDEENIAKEEMNALLAVGRASRHKPKVIHISYKPKNPQAVVSVIGKGLTYDSGGLSLKPSDFMVTMKLDKSGGAAVIGIMQAVSELGLPVEVHGFIGAVENMIGGDAYKPDDVLKAKNGKTIEVRNTDAEGRLVLADVLCYAQQEVKADYIFDMATLTGACVVGVGQYTTGVMGNNKELVEQMLYTGNISTGELMAHLPFNDYLRKTLKSNIADICNISNTRYGGAITAGLFLDEFIEKKNKEKWLHLDIAGPAFVESEWGENPYGASGVAVRSVTRFIEKITSSK
jgi:leucyl aminopeptidase